MTGVVKLPACSCSWRRWWPWTGCQHPPAHPDLINQGAGGRGCGGEALCCHSVRGCAPRTLLRGHAPTNEGSMGQQHLLLQLTQQGVLMLASSHEAASLPSLEGVPARHRLWHVVQHALRASHTQPGAHRGTEGPAIEAVTS